jgi:hypothetical protein
MEYDYINTVQKKQVISKEKYLPIFLNIFIVTGNQMVQLGGNCKSYQFI